MNNRFCRYISVTINKSVNMEHEQWLINKKRFLCSLFVFVLYFHYSIFLRHWKCKCVAWYLHLFVPPPPPPPPPICSSVCVALLLFAFVVVLPLFLELHLLAWRLFLPLHIWVRSLSWNHSVIVCWCCYSLSLYYIHIPKARLSQKREQIFYLMGKFAELQSLLVM